MDIGHWECTFTFNPDEWFGFVYRVIELDTGREYIGKKQFTKVKRKVIKGRQNRKHIKSESNWKTYTSSSTHLNEVITQKGKDNYRFQIQSLHKTKGSLHYAEIVAHVTEDVLRAYLADGVTRKYFNRNINGVKFIPPDELSEEQRAKHRAYNHSYWDRKTQEEINEFVDWYLRGDNQSSNRPTTLEDYQVRLDKHPQGDNNSLHGVDSRNKGKTYDEMYGPVRAAKIKAMLATCPKKTGEDHPLFGKPRPDDVREKISDKNKGMRTGQDNHMWGRPCTYKMTDEEKNRWKENISEATKGKPKSEEMKKKLSATVTGKKKATVTCPHCNKTGGQGNMKRYHFDNCNKAPKPSQTAGA